MKLVHVVMRTIDFEGGDIVAIFGSNNEAVSKAEELMADKDYAHSDVEYSVETHPVR